MLDKIRQLLEKQDIRYWEFRQEEVVTTSTTAWNGTIKDMSSGAKEGASLRILCGNGWGFAHSSCPDAQKLVQQAVTLAKAMDRYGQKKDVAFTKTLKKKVESNYTKHPNTVSLEEKRDLVLKASKLPEKINNLRVVYTDNIKKKMYTNSEGSEIIQKLCYTYYGAEATAAVGDRMESAYKAHGALRGYEITDGLMDTVTEACTIARNLLSASVPKGGTYPVIIDGTLTSVFVHEALGHATEADNLLSNSTCLAGNENKQVGSEDVTVFDDGTVPDSWGSFFYDDEGVPAHKTKIMDKGVFSSYLHSRETAALTKNQLTGNARAQSSAYLPLVRMSNTYIQPGDADFDEMVAEVKNGIYLRGSKGGQVDPITGNFQFSAQDGFSIKNGELAGYLRAVSLAGNTLAIVKNISLVQEKYEDGFSGHCGKNDQSVPVQGNNPSISITKATVGGS